LRLGSQIDRRDGTCCDQDKDEGTRRVPAERVGFDHRHALERNSITLPDKGPGVWSQARAIGGIVFQNGRGFGVTV
jgi:hypothetical protein